MDVGNLVYDRPDLGKFQVHRSSMTSQEIYELEMRRVFDRCWLYLGHESEVLNPGDYVRRVVAQRPLFFARDREGQLRVFHNTCPHRGALICRTEQGNASVFQCFYHAWSFNTSGELIGMPDIDGYGPNFDRAEMSLHSPRFDSYKGFIFVCFDAETESLVDYLAGAAEYLDLVADQSPAGMRVIPGSNRYTIKANWKLLAENSIDGYHLIPTHKTFFDYIGHRSNDVFSDGTSFGRALGNGHSVMVSDATYGRPIAKWHPYFGVNARSQIERVRDDLTVRFGPERAIQVADTNRLLLIFPNLIVQDAMAITVRVFYPTHPAGLDVSAWEMAPTEEPDNMLYIRMQSFLSFFGPGGFATPDDVEALESCQQGFRSGGVEWSDLSRGMTRAPRGDDELQMRSFWRRWRSLVSEKPYIDNFELGLTPDQAPDYSLTFPLTPASE